MIMRTSTADIVHYNDKLQPLTEPFLKNHTLNQKLLTVDRPDLHQRYMSI